VLVWTFPSLEAATTTTGIRILRPVAGRRQQYLELAVVREGHQQARPMTWLSPIVARDLPRLGVAGTGR